MTFSKEYAPSEFFDLLNEYSTAVRNGNYEKTIPYDIWKKLRKVNETVKVVVYPTIINMAVSIYEDIECLYCEMVENDGFASFFCNEKCKYDKEEKLYYRSAPAPQYVDGKWRGAFSTSLSGKYYGVKIIADGKIYLKFNLPAGNDFTVSPVNFCNALTDKLNRDDMLWRITRHKLLMKNGKDFI